MKSRKKLLLNTNLYLIADIADNRQADVLYHRIQKALKAGIKILQLRCKEAEGRLFLKFALRLRRLTDRNNALFIVNDRVDIAFNCDADGIHLGQDDLPLVCARNILGKDKIYGKSTHNLRQALQAQSERADYIGFGPIFKTETKPDADAIGAGKIRLLIKNIKIPFFTLGGINQSNIKEVVSQGAERAAVSNAILSKRNTRRAVEELYRSLKAPLRHSVVRKHDPTSIC